MKITLLFISFLLFPYQGSENELDTWEVATVSEDDILVKSRIVREQINGSTVKFLEYTATAVGDVEIGRCSEVVSNIEMHRFFLSGAARSELIEERANGSALIYYYFDATWPMKDYDCVFEMNKQVNKAGDEVIFSGQAAPDLYPMQGVKRVTYNRGSYTFIKQDDGQLLIEIETKVAPTVSYPDWALSTYFPDGPADIVQSIMRLAQD